MIGKRKKRKKPTGILGSNQFRFDGLDFVSGMSVFAYSDLTEELALTVASIVDAIDYQDVEFSSPVPYEEFESIEFGWD